ncbi:MAG: hypothetical protein ACXIVO_01185 [Glycocaulis sp.]
MTDEPKAPWQRKFEELNPYEMQQVAAPSDEKIDQAYTESYYHIVNVLVNKWLSCGNFTIEMEIFALLQTREELKISEETKKKHEYLGVTGMKNWIKSPDKDIVIDVAKAFFEMYDNHQERKGRNEA